jgi:hypothetical protein
MQRYDSNSSVIQQKQTEIKFFCVRPPFSEKYRNNTDLMRKNTRIIAKSTCFTRKSTCYTQNSTEPIGNNSDLAEKSLFIRCKISRKSHD